MKKHLFILFSVLISGLTTMWADETTYSPVLDVNFRTATGNTAWQVVNNAADADKTNFELTSTAGFFALQKYTVPDLQNATKLVLTLTVGKFSGVDAVRLWAFPMNDWTAASGIDDIYPKVKTALGVDLHSTEGTANTPLVTGAKVVGSDPTKATWTISGTALQTIKANASSDGTFTLLLTNDKLIDANNKRSYLSSNTANDELNRPQLVATTTAPAAKTVKNVTTGVEYETLNEAFTDAVAAGTDATLQLSGDQKLTDRLTLSKAITISLVPTKAITIKGMPGKIWFLANVNGAVLNVGGDETITLDGENKSFTGGDVAKYENSSTISLKNVKFQNFDLNNAGHLVGSKPAEGLMELENVTFSGCKNPGDAFIYKARVTNDRLVLRGFLNQEGCTGTTIYAASETKDSGTTGRIKIADNAFTANTPITISWPGTKAEGIIVAIGTTAENVGYFQLTDDEWTLERKNNGDLIMAKPLTPTVQIGTKGYADLTAALAAAQDGDNIELLADQEISSRVNIKNMSVTISGDYTIRRAATYTNGLLFLTQKADEGMTTALTLDGVTIDGQNVEATAAAIEASNNATTTLKNVTFKNAVNTANAVIVNKGGGKLVLNGVTFDGCTGTKGVVFCGYSVTLQGQNTIPSIYAEKALTITEKGATTTAPIALLTDANRTYSLIVEEGTASNYTSNAFRLSQQQDGVYLMPLAVAAAYTHPALLHTATDIARVKENLSKEPYKSAYSRLESLSAAAAAGAVEYLKRLDKNNWEGTYADYNNFAHAATDAKLAYELALRYQLKGSTAAATAAINILNDWATTNKGFLRVKGYENNIPDPNEYLMTIQAYQFANAAELLRDYTGWLDTDQEQFKNWIRQTFADVAILFLENHHNNDNALHYWLNWDLAALNALVSVGVLCDDKALVDYALNYVDNGTGTGNKANAITATHQDPDSEETLAQCQESGRDQGHATLDVTLLGVLCQTAQNANLGKDLFDEYKALEMAEYVGKYNLKDDAGEFAYDNVPFTAYNNGEENHTAIAVEARGTVRPSWELFLAYAQQNNKPARYSQQWAEWARRQNAYGEAESTTSDELGFGTLMFMRSDSYGYTLSISEAGAATLILPFEAVIPAEVKVYTLRYTAGEAVAQATEVTGTLPANTPVLAMADKGDYVFTANSAWQKANTYTEGALTGVYTLTTVPANAYILTTGASGLGFRKADGTTNKVDANRCYLTADSNLSRIAISFDDTTTAVVEIENGKGIANNAVYDLQGRPVNASTSKKGLYIVNGKIVNIK